MFFVFVLFCLTPLALFGSGVALGWYMRGRGGRPRLVWPDQAEIVADQE